MSRYPEGLLEYVKANYMSMDTHELAAGVEKEFGYKMNPKTMQSLKKNHGLSGGKKVQIYTDLFPKEICEYILGHYKGTGYQQMADILKQEYGREYTKQQIRSFYRNRHLDSGLKGNLFVKGQESHNKGQKMPPHVYEKAKATMFKKGNRPHNAVPIGTEVVRDDGYHQTKIAEPNVWMLTHLLIWQQAYGEIPDGMLISFKDGNRDHLELTNLFMETRAEHADMNRLGLRSSIPEYTEAGLNVVKLKRAIHSRKKKQEEDKPMAKRTKENTTRFTASKYKEMKHMDQERMRKAVNDYYWQGFNDAQEAAGFDIDKALEAISQIKGIGQGKLKEIEQVLKGAANGNETQ